MPADEYAMKPGPSNPVPNVSTDPVSAINPPGRGTVKGKPKAGSDFLALMGCNLIVFGASVCIMVLELSASRLIAVHLGQSLYTWTSVIGVVLAGITFGNYLGGWLADKVDPRKLLSWLFLISALTTFSVLWLNELASSTRPFDDWKWQFKVMTVVAMIFFVPSLALGTISPVTASMALSRSTKTGITLGNVYAWGALGSIVGTFLAGFYLIDAFGTKAIVQITATALLVMGALVASGQWAFRAAVLLGALQFVTVFGFCASMNEDRMQSACRWTVAGFTGWRTDEEYFKKDLDLLEEAKKNKDESAQKTITARMKWRSEWKDRETAWGDWGKKMGRHMHDIGLALALRSDDPREYYDESNYYAINVSPTSQDGEIVKELKLDHLIHSYYNPEKPQELYYDYEKVYAAITERAVNTWNRSVTVPISQELPSDVINALPRGVRYSEDGKSLTARSGLEFSQFKSIVTAGPLGDFSTAVIKMWEAAQADPNGFITTPLEMLPEGITIPNDLAGRVRYDATLRGLACSGNISLDDAIRIMASGPNRAFITEIYDLYRKSRQVSTLFIGGGGFVFPRWVEVKFPHNPLIDVAEIDPAVKLAVQLQMGLPADDETPVHTHIGDARKFVDDSVRANKKLVEAKKAPMLYDFAYGDAFNDFSVPWHLTTKEFCANVGALLSPTDGVYLVNIIDKYPRVQYPDEEEKEGKGEVNFVGTLPAKLNVGLKTGEWVNAPAPYKGLAIKQNAKANDYQLKYEGALEKDARKQLLDLVPFNARDNDFEFEGDGTYRDAIFSLSSQTTARKVYIGTPPAALMPANADDFEWTDCPPPFNMLQIQRREGKGYIFGLRGIMSVKTFDQLFALAPNDEEFRKALASLKERSVTVTKKKGGGFLGRYVKTLREVFPHVYVFSGSEDRVGDDRDTFVAACSMKKLDMSNLYQSGGYWRGEPFAWTETNEKNERVNFGQMQAVLELSEDLLLTDDHAPIDNLLVPVFANQ